MSLLTLVALLSAQPAAKAPVKPLFVAEEIAALSRQAQQDCGFANPQQLIGLADAVRKRAIACLVAATVKRSGSLLPKAIEPGATIVSASDFQGLLLFVVQFKADHPRALAPKNQMADYDNTLSNRTCQDKWLGGLIDAGLVDGVQGGTLVVYQMQNKQNENLAVIAVGQCIDAK